MRDCGAIVSETLRLEKLQNESSPNFSNFCPEFCPEFCSEFFRILRGFFALRFVGNGDEKRFTKNPCHFSMQNSQANTKKNIHEILLESRQSKKPFQNKRHRGCDSRPRPGPRLWQVQQTVWRSQMRCKKLRKSSENPKRHLKRQQP